MPTAARPRGWVPTAGGRPRRLTEWDNHWIRSRRRSRHDGSSLAVTVERHREDAEVVVVRPGDGGIAHARANSADAAIRPTVPDRLRQLPRSRDGAGLRRSGPASEMYVAAADGTDATRITHTPHMQESAPSWDPGGNRLAYGRARRRVRGPRTTHRGVERGRHLPKPVAVPPCDIRVGKSWIGVPTWAPGEGRARRPAQLLSAARTRSVTRRWAATLVWRSVRTSIRPVPAARAAGRSARESRRR